MKCPECGSEMEKKRQLIQSRVIAAQYGIVSNPWTWVWVCECGHEEKIKPFDPNEKPNWGTPTEEEAEAYLKVMEKSKEKVEVEKK